MVQSKEVAEMRNRQLLKNRRSLPQSLGVKGGGQRLGCPKGLRVSEHNLKDEPVLAQVFR